jgi:hypothetical protein
LEPEKYPEAKVAREIFDTQFGPPSQRDNTVICVFAFEPNPSHMDELNRKAKAYADIGWRYTVIHAGIADQDGQMTFYRMHDEDSKEWGFNAVREINARGIPGVPVTVPVMRLSTWMKKEIIGRKLPKYDPPISSAVNGPRVIMKFDVEGMEMSVIPDVLFSGVLCSSTDYIFGEMHYGWFFYPMHLRNNITLHNANEGKQYLQSLLTAIRINPHCKTVFEEKEDESHLHDGMPLPTAILAAT